MLIHLPLAIRRIDLTAFQPSRIGGTCRWCLLARNWGVPILNYIIRVISSEGEVLHSEDADESPSQSYLDELATDVGGVYCDVARK